MNKLVIAALMLSVAAPAVAESVSQPAVKEAVAKKGKMVVAAGGTRLGPVYRVAANGGVQLILEGRLITIPADTLSTSEDGKVVTSLSKKEALSLR